MAAFETPWLLSMSNPAAQAVPSAGNVSAAPPSTGLSSTVPTYASFVGPDSRHVQQTSPLLAQTPPTVTKALSQAYPYIVAADRVVALLTWTSNDSWASFLVVASWTAIVLHWEFLVRYAGHLLAVGGIAGYVYLHGSVDKEQEEHPTLDAIVHTLTTLTMRTEMFFSPITSLSLTTRDITRLLFTVLFLSPLYIVLTFYIMSPRSMLLMAGVFVLTYHSLPARVTRTILWRSRTTRLLTFYLTGLDFSRTRQSHSIVPLSAQPTNISTKSESDSGAFAPTYATSLASDVVNSLRNNPLDKHHSKDAVRFTYIVYENQRKWLGIGWTANLLAYERTAWTDEFLNECPGLDDFTLPDSEGTGMKWRWVDTQWRVDDSNGDEEGWIYYDNTWKKPTKEDAFGKYTRRRRWIRNAELVEDKEILADESVIFDPPVAVATAHGVEEDYAPEISNSVDSRSIQARSEDEASPDPTVTSPNNGQEERTTPKSTSAELDDSVDLETVQDAIRASSILPGSSKDSVDTKGHNKSNSYTEIKRRSLLRHKDADTTI
ncbi:integral peroxisomal membrane peroxin-domain-containing protein [Dipodascopsis uninucleata]